MEGPIKEDTPLGSPERGSLKLDGTELRSTQLTVVDRIRQHANPLQGVEADYVRLLNIIGDARFVLIGEASHGTHDFYDIRAGLTRLLIEQKGFSAVAVEADWPDAYRVNRFVQGGGEDQSPEAALSDFKRFPAWMWRNTVVAEFVRWLRAYNASQPPERPPVGFYGLDLYSLRASMEAVVSTLERVDPEAARRARYRYSCFDHFGEDPATYGYAAAFDLNETCERQVLEQLNELSSRALAAVRQDGFVGEDELFYAEGNARVAKNAEEYYRAMFSGSAQPGVHSWNLRDGHMLETLEALSAHLGRSGAPVKTVVWAHNSHLGDARATELSRHGELNLGQLVREKHGAEAALIGFTTYTGTVTAASDWGGPPEQQDVRPALPGSYEELFHTTGIPRFSLLLTGMEESLADLRREMLERAIGVVYRPQTERVSHYFSARLMDQFDAVIHLDETRALQPLDGE